MFVFSLGLVRLDLFSHSSYRRHQLLKIYLVYVGAIYTFPPPILLTLQSVTGRFFMISKMLQITSAMRPVPCPVEGESVDFAAPAGFKERGIFLSRVLIPNRKNSFFFCSVHGANLNQSFSNMLHLFWSVRIYSVDLLIDPWWSME